MGDICVPALKKRKFEESDAAKVVERESKQLAFGDERLIEWEESMRTPLTLHMPRVKWTRSQVGFEGVPLPEIGEDVPMALVVESPLVEPAAAPVVESPSVEPAAPVRAYPLTVVTTRRGAAAAEAKAIADAEAAEAEAATATARQDVLDRTAAEAAARKHMLKAPAAIVDGFLPLWQARATWASLGRTVSLPALPAELLSPILASSDAWPYPNHESDLSSEEEFEWVPELLLARKKVGRSFSYLVCFQELPRDQCEWWEAARVPKKLITSFLRMAQAAPTDLSTPPAVPSVDVPNPVVAAAPRVQPKRRKPGYGGFFDLMLADNLEGQFWDPEKGCLFVSIAGESGMLVLNFPPNVTGTMHPFPVTNVSALHIYRWQIWDSPSIEGEGRW